MVVVHWVTGLFPLITHGKNFTSMVDNFRESVSISGNKLTFDDLRSVARGCGFTLEQKFVIQSSKPTLVFLKVLVVHIG